MSSHREEQFYVEDDKLYYHAENDRFAFMRNGPEAVDVEIGSVRGAKILLRSLNKGSLSENLEKLLEEHN